MARDEKLAQRVRHALGGLDGLLEKRMFGGICFMLNGNMCCGVLNYTLILRVGPEQHAEALARPYARPFDLTGRAMKGWVMVDAPGCASDQALNDWLSQGIEFARSLPEK